MTTLLTIVDRADGNLFHLDGGNMHTYRRMIHHMDEGIGWLVDALRQRIRAVKVGPALAAGTDIGPVINQRQLDMVQRYIDVYESLK